MTISNEVTQEELAELLAGTGRRNKYNAQKVRLDGYTFDSQAEATRYGELRLLERVGEIEDLEVHPKFELQGPFTDKWDRDWKPITYTADFAYTETDTGRRVVEDVKGGKATQTPLFKTKAALFQKQHPDVVFRVEER